MDQVAATWPASVRGRLRVTLGPAGQTVLSPPPPKPLVFFPWLALAILFAASLLFSALLAANLARPVSQLRDGLRKLSGDLDVRLTAGETRSLIWLRISTPWPSGCSS